MLEVMPESAGPLLWLRASEQITDQDYREVFVPQVEKIVRDHGKVRLLLHLAPDFQGWTAGAMWDDVKLARKHWGDFAKVALAGAPFWADALLKLFAHFMPGETRTFLREYLAEAWFWIQE